MKLKKNLKEYWKLNGVNYLIVCGLFTLMGVFLIVIKNWHPQTYLTFPAYYMGAFLFSFTLSWEGKK